MNFNASQIVRTLAALIRHSLPPIAILRMGGRWRIQHLPAEGKER